MSSKGFITAEEVMNNLDLDESGFVYNTKKEYLSCEEFEKRKERIVKMFNDDWAFTPYERSIYIKKIFDILDGEKE